MQEIPKDHESDSPAALVEDLAVTAQLEKKEGFPLRGRFPVVGLGGSAGSIGALQEFFSQVPTDSGMAYAVVVHLSPEHDSILASILQRSSCIPVVQVTEPVKLQADHVYVVPPNKQLAFSDGLLKTVGLDRPKGRHVTIDLFFRTLAEAHGSAATAIVLSGGDGDGAVGLKRVKEWGGLTIVQDPEEAEQASMPLTAIETGLVDWILPVAEMSERLSQYQQNGRNLQLPPDSPASGPTVSDDEKAESALRDILAFVKSRTGRSFRLYKRATILRRIGRRMQVTGNENLERYLAFLRTHPGETGALLQDLLISVTNFFRDSEAFEALDNIVPEFFKHKTPGEEVRVWVPACATGEEAYSLAILLSEHAAKLPSPPTIQIFATDLDRTGINTARDGRYPHAIAADISEERLHRFFIKEGGNYRVRRELRETVLFAVHDILEDSPFSRLDLISCRNLLIYLNRQAQGKVFDTAHFALRPGGHLLLGTSESAEEACSIFDVVDRKNRLYVRRQVKRGVSLTVPTGSATLAFALNSFDSENLPVLPRAPQKVANEGQKKNDYATRKTWGELHLKLIERLAPASLVVSRDHEIVHLTTSAGRYLQFAGGEPSANLLQIVHPALRTELRAALFRAVKSSRTAKVKPLAIEINGSVRHVGATVECVEELSSEFLLVIFQEVDPAETSTDKLATGPGDEIASRSVIQQLEEELDEMRTRQRETVEQFELSAEDLKASNEELQAMNEELRSATKELETGREELQSINEEIITINQELKSKLEELSRANSDLQNLIAATDIPTIFLDQDLQIARFTPPSAKLFNFNLNDIGRPLADFTHRLHYPEIISDAENVLDRMIPQERMVRDNQNRWFLARILPYRTSEDKIGGVVITFVDITARKEADDSRRWLSVIVESSNDAIISFSMEGKIISWNPGAERVFGYREDEVRGQDLEMLVPPDRYEQQRAVLDKLNKGESIELFETFGVRKDGLIRDISVSASVMKRDMDGQIGATAIIQDITTRNQAVRDLIQAKDELENQVTRRTSQLTRRAKQLETLASELTFAEQRERKRVAQILHDQLQQILVTAKMRIESLDCTKQKGYDSEVEKLVSLMDEALSSSRSLAVELSPPILSEGLGKALEWLCRTWMKEKHKMNIETDIDSSIDARHEDMRILVFLAVKELLFNVVKHSTVDEAQVELDIHNGEYLRVVVRDHGQGFDTEDLKARNKGGSGFGLMSLRERLELLGGSLKIRSKPNDGVEAVIIAPRLAGPESKF